MVRSVARVLRATMPSGAAGTPRAADLGRPSGADRGPSGTVRERVNAGVVGRPNSWWPGGLACADVRGVRHAHVLRAGVAGRVTSRVARGAQERSGALRAARARMSGRGRGESRLR